jgi:hypothetical protein
MQRTRGLTSCSSVRENGRRSSAVDLSSVFVMSAAVVGAFLHRALSPYVVVSENASTYCLRTPRGPFQYGSHGRPRDGRLRGRQRHAAGPLRMESPNQKAIRFPDSCIDGVESLRRLAIPRHRRGWRDVSRHRSLQLDQRLSCATTRFHRRRGVARDGGHANATVNSSHPRGRRVLVRCAVLVDELDLCRASAVHEPLTRLIPFLLLLS